MQQPLESSGAIPTRTQVGIIGAGPAGLLLGRLLHLSGIDSVILEVRDRAYVEQRVRAGLLEQTTVDVLTQAGVDGRLREVGFEHRGVEIRFDGERRRIPVHELTGGRSTWLYPQQEVVRDLVAARLDVGDPLVFEAADVQLSDLTGDRPRITYRVGDETRVLDCDVIAGCDGFHGAARQAIPPSILQTFARTYPFAWLGIMADVPPSTYELIYAHHPHGFAMHSLRSSTLSRFYLQVEPDEDLSSWTDARLWDELQLRLATNDDWTLAEGTITARSITPMRSFVSEPMQYGNLFLAGDAAHIVPPTAAKGLNLAVADVVLLADALDAWLTGGNRSLLEGYSAAALSRVWQVQEFSRMMTSLLHHERSDPFDARLQRAQLVSMCESTDAMASWSHRYAGLPMTWNGDGRSQRPVLNPLSEGSRS